MKVAVVILNWNGKTLLQRFLPNVIQYSTEAEIIVVDNHSTDDSSNFLATHFPKIKIIKNTENGGYAKGYNDALKHIEADIFCLLNNDVEVTENWLNPIIQTFENEENTVIVQPKILDYNRKNKFEYAGAAGGFIDKFGYPYCRGRIFETLEEDLGQYDDCIEIFWASGACFFIRKSVFEKLEGFDEKYFAHMEEIDLCWRAKNLSYTIKFNCNSVVYHIGGASLKYENPKKTFLNFRNSLFSLTKNAQGVLFPIIFFRLLLDGIAGIKFLINLKPLLTWAVLKSHLNFYSHLPILLKERRKFKTKMPYYTKTSIVFDYFIKKKRNFC